MRKYRLKCFTCQNLFASKTEVYFDMCGYPICTDCLNEEMNDFWTDYDSGDYDRFVIDRSFKKYFDAHEEHTCPKCRSGIFVLKGEEFTNCLNCSWRKYEEEEE